MKTEYKYINDTLKLRDTIETAFIAMGERFYKIRTETYWKGRYESYQEFLADMRVSEANASKLEAVYRTYVVEHKVKPERLARVGWSNLYEAIPLLETQGVDVVIEKAVSLRRADIQDEAREAKSGEHDHKWETVTVRVCEVCNKKERVN